MALQRATCRRKKATPVARGILQRIGADTGIIDRVCHIIGNHHSYHKIDGMDFQILVEADFLVNIAEDAMDRESILSIKKKCFKTQCGVELLESMYLP